MKGTFLPDKAGTILKMYNEREKNCLTKLSNDVLRGFVPEYMGETATDDGKRILFQFNIHSTTFL